MPHTVYLLNQCARMPPHSHFDYRPTGILCARARKPTLKREDAERWTWQHFSGKTLGGDNNLTFLVKKKSDKYFENVKTFSDVKNFFPAGGCPYRAIEKNPSRFELFILEINSFPCTIQVCFFEISLFTVMKSDLSHKMNYSFCGRGQIS